MGDGGSGRTCVFWTGGAWLVRTGTAAASLDFAPAFENFFGCYFGATFEKRGVIEEGEEIFRDLHVC